MRLARPGPAVGAALLTLSLGACSLPGRHDDAASVFSIQPGQCFMAPTEVKAQISDLTAVDCGKPHDLEAYAEPAYVSDNPEVGDDVFPGDDALNAFAQGACAQQFAGWVGIDYLNSSLYFTYLLPSARSWEQSDRKVICLLRAAGRELTGSAKDTRK